MILADKITALRKKAGWSQEELAEQLGVTRQSVSKWEGAQSVPDMDKVVQMSRLFGVTTDFLLKDELSEEEPAPEGCDSPLRRVTMAEASEYLALRRAALRRHVRLRLRTLLHRHGLPAARYRQRRLLRLRARRREPQRHAGASGRGGLHPREQGQKPRHRRGQRHLLAARHRRLPLLHLRPHGQRTAEIQLVHLGGRGRALRRGHAGGKAHRKEKVTAARYIEKCPFSERTDIFCVFAYRHSAQ